MGISGVDGHLLNTLRLSRMVRKAAKFSRRHVKRTLVPSTVLSSRATSAGGGGSASAVTPIIMSSTGTCDSSSRHLSIVALLHALTVLYITVDTGPSHHG